MASRWYNPLSWRMFGFNDPKTGEFVEVDMTVGGRNTKSGERITPKTAISIPMVWSCVKILSESGGGLPLKAYEDVNGERQLANLSTRRQRLLRKPSPYTTMLVFLKAVIANMALRGNAYAIIERNREGEWIGTTLVCADNVEIDTEGDELIYWVTLKGDRFPVSPEHMLHFKLFSMDGIAGMSPVEHMAETMGLAKAGQSWSARFMRKGGFAGGYVIYKQFLTETQHKQIMARFPDIREGDTQDVGKMAVLQGGPEIVPAGLSQKDAQFIESQQFQEEALAGIWGVPLHLANRASKTSIVGSNVEQQTINFMTFGLGPYTLAIEDELNSKLFGGDKQFVEFVMEGLLRSDSAGRATYYQAALGGSGGSGWMTINEVRRRENLSPLQGDEYNRVSRWEMQKNAQQN